MKTKNILYPVALMLMLVLPLVRYYISTPWVNACVLDYVDNLEESDYHGYLYDINGNAHIEAANNKGMVDSLTEYKVWEANGCIMASGNLYANLTNTFYCAIAYMIRKSPLPKELKEPKGFFNWNDIKK